MSPATSNAIAAFLKNGGRVVKGQSTVPATGPEVVDYLVSCGIRTKYLPGNPKSYVYEGKRYSLAKFVECANIHRKARQLPPFVIRLNMHIGGRRASD